MRLGSCLYGFVIHVAVFLFVGASMLLVMAVAVPLVFCSIGCQMLFLLLVQSFFYYSSIL